MTILASEIGIALRSLLRNVRRSSVAILTVGAGVAAYLLAGGFVAYIFQEMREATIHAHLGHLQIVRPGYFDRGVADPMAYLLPSEEGERGLIEQAAQPVAIAARLSFSGLLSLGDITVPFFGEGVDPTGELLISSRVTMVQGHPLDASASDKVLLGEGLAKGLGAKAGDSVVMLVTRKGGGPGALELKVGGIFSTSSKEYDDYAVRLPIALARHLLRVDGATSWVVLLARTEATETALDALKRVLPADRFNIVPWIELADFYNKTVLLFTKQVEVVRFIIGLIIVLTIMNILTMSVMERTTEIGTSLALGLPAQLVMGRFVIEGVLIGVLGGVVGLALGYILASVISVVGIPMPPPPGMAHGYLARILVTVPLMFDAVLLALLTTLVASLVPAWRAGRMNIVDALRYGQ